MTNDYVLKKEIEEKNRQLLSMEYWILIPTIIVATAIVIVVSYAEMPLWSKTVLIASAAMQILILAFAGTYIEQIAGYYECQHCHHELPLPMLTHWK